jgi:hypothetical protein
MWAIEATPGRTWQSGEYYTDRRRLPRRPNRQQNDAVLADALWAESARRVGLSASV